MLYLFDIDGTLVHCAGVGRQAMNYAFARLFHVEDAFNRVDFRGSLDSTIVRDAFSLTGIPPREPALRAFRSLYLERLRETLDPREDPRQHFCKGVPRVLDHFEEHGALGLVTGNWRAGARGKLEAFGIWDRFAFGAFGDDATRREDLVPLAVARAGALGLSAERVVVIGDTPADVKAARAYGALAVAVRTGWSSRQDLEASAPDLLVDDLESGLHEVLDL